ncbi:MAG: hypothetical protein M3Z66_22805 [Chloroflexota bacterium]|nr:hypothetical protein [Chloroflexota bacterium]
MVTDLVVGREIGQGEELLRALDRARFPVCAALWSLKAGTWRYVIASSVVVDEGAREAYRQVNDILRSTQVGMSLADITVVGPQDPVVQALRPVVHTGPDEASGVRVTADTINHVFIEDGSIHRMA